jgi:hypothetical protein
MKIFFGEFTVTKHKSGYTLAGKDYKNNEVREWRPFLASALNRVKKHKPVTNREIENVMERVNAVFLDGLGVEAIRDPSQWIDFWTTTRALYVNLGDTYINTLLYDTKARKFRDWSWGDFVEKFDKKGTW